MALLWQCAITRARRAASRSSTTTGPAVIHAMHGGALVFYYNQAALLRPTESQPDELQHPMSFDQSSLALFSLPFITGLIGWITNYIAIKMLFHPRHPIKLGPWRIQGVIPRRQKDIASQLGGIVAHDLLSPEDLSQQLTTEQSRRTYEAFIDSQTEHFIRNKLSVIPGSSLLLRSRTLSRLKSAFADELMEQIPPLVSALTRPDDGGLDIQQWVEEKVRAFSTERMEDMLYKILAREFRFIELLGGVLGFIIGSVQLLFIFATQ